MSREFSGAGGVVGVCFITSDPSGTPWKEEITTLPISGREITLPNCIFARSPPEPAAPYLRMPPPAVSYFESASLSRAYHSLENIKCLPNKCGTTLGTKRLNTCVTCKTPSKYLMTTRYFEVGQGHPLTKFFI